MRLNFSRAVILVVLMQFFPCGFVLCLENEKPNRIDVTVSPAISFDKDRNIFSYSYSVESTAKSIQEVHIFCVTTDKFYSHPNSPAGWVDFKSTPVNIPTMVEWGAIGGSDNIPANGILEPSPFNIKPGQTISGFSFESEALPGICKFFSEGFVIISKVSEEPPEEQLPPYEFGQDAFKGQTIGPVLIGDQSIGGLIDRLISLKDSMPSYGWLTNQGIINSLNVKLNAVKESVVKGNNKTAINQLKAFNNELDAQKGKQVNDNAWALLKANAEFLIHKLGD